MAPPHQIDRQRRQNQLVRKIKQVLQQMPAFEDDPSRLSMVMFEYFLGNELPLAEDHVRDPESFSPFSGEAEFEAYLVCAIELGKDEFAEAERRFLDLRPDFLGPIIRPAE
ncbi:MAG: hypothetical protein ACK4UY_15110 [Dietzia sp.]